MHDIEQAIRYREDIKNYHKVRGDLNLEVESFLVLTKSSGKFEDVRSIKILNKENFNESVFKNSKGLSNDESQRWIDSKYEPILSIIYAAHKLFFDGDLPDIKNIANGEIHNTVSKVESIVRENESKDKKQKVNLDGIFNEKLC